jgi:hypothetical protein
MQEERATPAELLMLAGGKEDRANFLLGYVSSSVPGDIIFAAMKALQDFEAAGRSWQYVLDAAQERPYDPRD